MNQDNPQSSMNGNGQDETSMSDREIEHQEAMDAADNKAVEGAAKLAPKLIYEVIRRDGLEEMERPFSALFWSGIAAGVMISLSVLGEAIFRTYLPDTGWGHLIENLGYSLGFLVVILARMQLFTENTITTVLPVMDNPTQENFLCAARLWAVVIIANVIGAFAVALLFAHTSAIPAELRPALAELSHHATGFPALEAFQRAIPAGVIIAAIVWMLPQAEGSEIWVIIIFTWLIAAGDFTHVVAGSVEMAYLAWTGEIGFFHAVFQFFIPVFLGNVTGGTVIFATLAYGQVREERERQRRYG